jgi:predicted transcriptional regulator
MVVTREPAIGVFRPDRQGIRKVLGDLEAEIMELVWARPVGQGTTVREIFEMLYERRRLAYTTVMNTVARLARKHLLRVAKDVRPTSIIRRSRRRSSFLASSDASWRTSWSVSVE